VSVFYIESLINRTSDLELQSDCRQVASGFSLSFTSYLFQPIMLLEARIKKGVIVEKRTWLAGVNCKEVATPSRLATVKIHNICVYIIHS
jgi:hypothetical protein